MTCDIIYFYIYDVIKSAEKIMYADKENYYIETGKDRRK